MGIGDALALDAGVGLERENLHILAERLPAEGGTQPGLPSVYRHLEAGRPAF